MLCTTATNTSNTIRTQTGAAQFFTGRMPFLPPNQQRQSTEGTNTRIKYTRDVHKYLMAKISVTNDKACSMKTACRGFKIFRGFLTMALSIVAAKNHVLSFAEFVRWLHLVRLELSIHG